MSLARYLSKLGALLNSDGKVPSGALASGAARANFGAGAVLQVISDTHTGGSQTTTSTSYVEFTGLSVTITPSSASSKIFVMVTGGHPFTNTGSGIIITIYRDATDLSGESYGLMQNYNSASVVHTAAMAMSYLDSPSTTSAVTYKVYYKSRAGQTVAVFEGGSKPVMTVMEIAG